MQKIISRVWPVALALTLSLLILRPVLGSGVWYPMHDSTHPARVILMQWTMLAGQFPPIWADTINGGYGYPLFHFYAPLFHLFTSLIGFHAFMPIPTTALKITLGLTTIIGAMGIMMLARRWGRSAAIVAAVAFTTSPFIALELYVRGAFSEYLSLSILPWVLLSTESLSSWRKVTLAASSIALFVLSHNLVPILALPMIIVWMMYHNRRQYSRVAWTIMLAVGLSAWFTLPLVFERHFTRADEIARTTEYALHFIEPWQLWNSTWGFGGSTVGVEDGMSFKLGKLQIILGVLGVVAGLIKKRASLTIISAFLAISVYLATPYAKIVWDTIPLLQLVQFPWRTLGIVVLLLALLGGFAVSRVPTKPLRTLVTVVLIAGFWYLGAQYFAPQAIITSRLDNREEFTSDEMPDIAAVVPEYLPIWLQRDKLMEQYTVSPDIFWESERVMSRDRDDVEGWTPEGYVYEFINDGDPSWITLGLAYYPTWEARIDGQKVIVKPDELGLVSVELPQGTHAVSLTQSHTPLQKLSYALTLASIVFAIYLWRRS